MVRRSCCAETGDERADDERGHADRRVAREDLHPCPERVTVGEHRHLRRHAGEQAQSGHCTRRQEHPPVVGDGRYRERARTEAGHRTHQSRSTRRGSIDQVPDRLCDQEEQRRRHDDGRQETIAEMELRSQIGSKYREHREIRRSRKTKAPPRSRAMRCPRRPARSSAIHRSSSPTSSPTGDGAAVAATSRREWRSASWLRTAAARPAMPDVSPLPLADGTLTTQPGRRETRVAAVANIRIEIRSSLRRRARRAPSSCRNRRTSADGPRRVRRTWSVRTIPCRHSRPGSS